MPTMKRRIQSVFGVELPVGGGSAGSLADPLFIRREGASHPEEVIKQWLHYRSILEEKNQTLQRKVRILQDGKPILRYDLLCCSQSLTEDVSRTEHLYFDLSEWETFATDNDGLQVDAAVLGIPRLFPTLDNYLDFYLDEEALSITAVSGSVVLTLKRCPEQGRWSLVLEDEQHHCAVGIFLEPFDPTPKNLHHFESQCNRMAVQLQRLKAQQKVKEESTEEVGGNKSS